MEKNIQELHDPIHNFIYFDVDAHSVDPRVQRFRCIHQKPVDLHNPR